MTEMKIEQMLPGWMLVGIESVVVGVYCVLLFWVIQQVIYSADWNMFLFVLGFFKHALGYLLGIQNVYCRYGYACKNIKPQKKKKDKNINANTNAYLDKTVESVFEGIAFVFFGNLVSATLTTNKTIVVFTTGCLLYILSEIVGLHTYFCERCIKR